MKICSVAPLWGIKMPCTWTVYLLAARRLLNHCTPHTSTAGKAWGLAMAAFQGQTSTAASHPFVERMARVFEGNRFRSKHKKILNRDLNKGSKSFRAQLRLVRDEVMKKISLCWLFPIFSSFSLIVKYAPQSSQSSHVRHCRHSRHSRQWRRHQKQTQLVQFDADSSNEGFFTSPSIHITLELASFADCTFSFLRMKKFTQWVRSHVFGAFKPYLETENCAV